MYREQTLKCLKSLKLPKEGYCLFGGVCLAIRDIRSTDDIDIYVTDQLYQRFKQAGWREKSDLWPEPPYLVAKIHGMGIEVYRVFVTEIWQPKFQQYLVEPEIIDGYRFMPLDELYEWKAAVRRPKDVRDLKLIDAFMVKQKKL